MAENHLILDGPDHPACQGDAEEKRVEIPLTAAMLRKLAAWSVERPDVMWIFLNEYIEAGHAKGDKWEMVDAEPTKRGVVVTVRRVVQ